MENGLNCFEITQIKCAPECTPTRTCVVLTRAFGESQVMTSEIPPVHNCCLIQIVLLTVIRNLIGCTRALIQRRIKWCIISVFSSVQIIVLVLHDIRFRCKLRIHSYIMYLRISINIALYLMSENEYSQSGPLSNIFLDCLLHLLPGHCQVHGDPYLPSHLNPETGCEMR